MKGQTNALQDPPLSPHKRFFVHMAKIFPFSQLQKSIGAVYVQQVDFQGSHDTLTRVSESSGEIQGSRTWGRCASDPAPPHP